jgi:hypothetical protein
VQIDAVEVRTCDRVKGSSVPDGYIHVVITGIVKADDAVELAEAAADPIQFKVAADRARPSVISDEGVTKIGGERAMLRAKGRL